MGQCSIYKRLIEQLREFEEGEIDVRCEAVRELDQIRATLLVNFGRDAKHNKQIFFVEDNGTTLSMVISVLTKLMTQEARNE